MGFVVGRAFWRRTFSSIHPKPEFGILFDIDGVIKRGSRVLANAPKAFQRLVDDEGKFRVPVAFVTNAGNSLRKTKADQLTKWLGVEIVEDQVVMSHSPLKMFKEYHDKHVLVAGQGEVMDIAYNLGFTKVTSIDQFRHAFPTLDAVDHKRRCCAVPCGFEPFFPRIEAIVLFGEPVRWETSLQLLVDTLVSDGRPSHRLTSIPYPHVPILACNTDLQWMAEAVIPRFGHGAFLLCLENLYKKVTDKELVYTALIGKPSEITYRHSEHVLQAFNRNIGNEKPLRNIYFVGDNICTDIFGANLYHRYLEQKRHDNSIVHLADVAASRRIDRLVGADTDMQHGAQNCFSVLVKTGVYCDDDDHNRMLKHSPRDFLPVEKSYTDPTIVASHVLEAVDEIFIREKFT